MRNALYVGDSTIYEISSIFVINIYGLIRSAPFGCPYLWFIQNVHLCSDECIGCNHLHGFPR